MEKINRFWWLAGLSITLILLALFFAHVLSPGSFIVYLPVAIALTITGISVLLLRQASGVLKFTGLTCSWCGFLLLTSGAFSFLELSTVWNVAISLLLAGLLAGMYVHFSKNGSRMRWLGIFASVLALAVTAGILLKVQDPVFYKTGSIALVFFSVSALLASVLKPNPERN